MSGPEVVQSVDTTTWSSGLGVIDDLHQLGGDFASKSWVSGSLNAAGLVADTVGFVVDPLGTVLAWGAAWVLDHLEPLKGWLNDLTGDAGQVRGIGATWVNIGAFLTECSSDIAEAVASQIADMQGRTVEAYTAFQKTLGDSVAAVGSASAGFGQAVSLAAELVQVVHDLVRDALSEIIGSLGSAIIEATASFGILIPKVIADISRKVSSWGAKLGKKVDELVASFEALQRLLKKLENLLSGLKSSLRSKFPNLAKALDFKNALKGRIDDYVTSAGTKIGNRVGRDYQFAKHTLHDHGLKEGSARLWNNVVHPDLRASALAEVRRAAEAPDGLQQLDAFLRTNYGKGVVDTYDLHGMSTDDIKSMMQTRYSDLPENQQKAAIMLSRFLDHDATAMRSKGMIIRDGSFSYDGLATSEGKLNLYGFTTRSDQFFSPTPGTKEAFYREMALNYGTPNGVNPPPGPGDKLYSLHGYPSAPPTSTTYGMPLHEDAKTWLQTGHSNGQPSYHLRPSEDINGVTDPFTGTGTTGGVDKLHTEWAQNGKTPIRATGGFILEHSDDGGFRVDAVMDPKTGKLRKY